MQNRKDLILQIINDKQEISISGILLELNTKLDKKVSKVTLNRDIKEIVDDSLIIKKGSGPGVYYKISKSYKVLKSLNIDEYFEAHQENRKAKESLDFDIFGVLKDINIFTGKESEILLGLNLEYQDNIANLPSDIIKKEFERLTIELSWKSSRIEGNTYNLLETEFLLKEKKQARGHTSKEAAMIINHKDVLDYINNNKEDYKEISTEKIENIHFLLTKDLGIIRGIREKKVGITGTNYKPLSKTKEIILALEKLCKLINQKKSILEKTILANVLIAYIQPFNDGNKRTSRLIGNAILIAHGYCPLSFRSVDELEYKKAIIIFYEQNNMGYFKKLFKEQFEFAVKNYFLY
ncbi:Fic family protein [Candidatus Parcubacteria bacterium]|nr:Fic family protein [Candidatus Parcubacteria bacterium]